MSQAHLTPDLDVEQIREFSERTVAVALLDTLDGSWTILHSYPWLRPNRIRDGEQLREGEADFVLLHRDHGLLVVEVKGGKIRYDANDRSWFSGPHRIKDPFSQAGKNMHALRRQILDRVGGSQLPCAYGYAVVFPDCAATGPAPPGADPAILLDGDDLPQLGGKLIKALGRWAGTKRTMAPVVCKRVKEALLPAFRLVPLMSRRIASDEEILVRLTEQQQQALEGLYENSQVRVEGTAGSGKTMLAIQRARQFAMDGQRTLFLCFNKQLAEELSRQQDHDNLGVRHFHGLASDLCRKAGLPFRPPTDQAAAASWWQEHVPELMVQATDQIEARFDAIVVDEAQDFHKNWWLPIELLEAENASRYYFYDREQDVYGGDQELPDTPVKYTLRTNCRNTRQIVLACEAVRDIEIQVWQHAPEGTPAVVRRYNREDGCAKIVQEELKRLLDEGRLAPSQVAILGPYTRRKGTLGLGKLGKFSLTEDLEAWRKNVAVLYSTARAFKGLEAQAVILIDIGELDPKFFGKVDLYVACSRAKHELVVCTCSDEVNKLLT